MALTSDKIAEYWPEHAEHNTDRRLPSYDRTAGYLCGCGENLGHPVQDEPEEAADFEPDAVNTTFQRPASEAGAAAWDRAASVVQKARQGAYGTWGVPAEPFPDEPEDAEDAEGPVYFSPVTAEAGSSGFSDTDPRANADGPVADEAQTYSVGGAGDGEVEYGPDGHAGLAEVEPADPADGPIYDPTKDPEWRRVQAQSDADFIGDDEPTMDPESAGRDEESSPEEVDPESTLEPSTVEPGQQAALFPDSTAPEPGSGRGIMPPKGDMDDPVASALPGPLDATEVYTPKDVEMAIVDILARLDRGELFLRGQLARLHEADYALKMRNAHAIARSDQRAADQRAAEATILCAKEIYEQTEAAMLVRALRDTMHNLRSQLMGFQTVAKSVGVSINAPSFRP